MSKKIDAENVGNAKHFRLEKLISTLEDQDRLLESMIDKMPKCEEKTDLREVKSLLIEFIGKVDGYFSI